MPGTRRRLVVGDGGGADGAERLPVGLVQGVVAVARLRAQGRDAVVAERVAGE